MCGGIGIDKELVRKMRATVGKLSLEVKNAVKKSFAGGCHRVGRIVNRVGVVDPASVELFTEKDDDFQGP